MHYIDSYNLTRCNVLYQLPLNVNINTVCTLILYRNDPHISIQSGTWFVGTCLPLPHSAEWRPKDYLPRLHVYVHHTYRDSVLIVQYFVQFHAIHQKVTSLNSRSFSPLLLGSWTRIIYIAVYKNRGAVFIARDSCCDARYSDWRLHQNLYVHVLFTGKL